MLIQTDKKKTSPKHANMTKVSIRCHRLPLTIVLNEMLPILDSFNKTCPVFLIQEFAGNRDRDSAIYHTLGNAIRARYIRFRPIAWHNHISMRVEVYGCQGTVGFLLRIYSYILSVFVLVYCNIFLLHSVYYNNSALTSSILTPARTNITAETSTITLTSFVIDSSKKNISTTLSSTGLTTSTLKSTLTDNSALTSSILTPSRIKRVETSTVILTSFITESSKKNISTTLSSAGLMTSTLTSTSIDNSDLTSSIMTPERTNTGKTSTVTLTSSVTSFSDMSKSGEDKQSSQKQVFIFIIKKANGYHRRRSLFSSPRLEYERIC